MNSLVERLVAKLPSDEVFPSGVVVPIKPKIRGRSFFPGGCGTFMGAAQRLPKHPVMLVGQDFGTFEYWNEVDERGETRQGTWSGLEHMLENAKLDPQECFFTNVLLGVRVGGPIDGPSQGLAYPRYVEACTGYLMEQIRILVPTVVVALGKVPSILLARLLGLTTALAQPSENDARNPSWPTIDATVAPFHELVRDDRGAEFAFATSVHPDRHWLNQRFRTWACRGVRGEESHNLIWKCIADAHRSAALRNA